MSLLGLGPGASLWLVVVVLGAALIRGYSGFGFSALVITAATLVMNPLGLVAAVVLTEAAMSAQSWSGLGTNIDWTRVRRLSAGALLGVPLGLWALTQVSDDSVRIVIALYVLVMCLVLMAGFRLGREAGRKATWATGLASGMANAPGMGGLPVVAFLAAQPIRPAVFRATVVAYFLALDLMSAPLYWLAGLVTHDTLAALAVLLPLSLLGNWLGSRHFLRTDPQDFRRFAILLLAVLAGLALLRSVV